MKPGMEPISETIIDTGIGSKIFRQDELPVPTAIPLKMPLIRLVNTHVVKVIKVILI